MFILQTSGCNSRGYHNVLSFKVLRSPNKECTSLSSKVHNVRYINIRNLIRIRRLQKIERLKHCQYQHQYQHISYKWFALLGNVFSFSFQFSLEPGLLVLGVRNRDCRQCCYGWARFRYTSVSSHATAMYAWSYTMHTRERGTRNRTKHGTLTCSNKHASPILQIKLEPKKVIRNSSTQLQMKLSQSVEK